MYADALLGLIILTLLAVVFYGPWQATCTDWARNVIFESRDHIFDMALAGELDFRSEEYREIRESLQMLIRHSHTLTLPMLCVHLASGVNEGQSSLLTHINRIPSRDVRNKVRAHVKRAQEATMFFLAAKSLPGLLIIIAAAIAAVFNINRRKYLNMMSELIQKDAELSTY